MTMSCKSLTQSLNISVQLQLVITFKVPLWMLFLTVSLSGFIFREVVGCSEFEGVVFPEFVESAFEGV